MNGQALGEEQLHIVENKYKGDISAFVIHDLIATIRERDQTIASLEMGDNEALQGWMKECSELREQNTLMLSALRWYADPDVWRAPEESIDGEELETQASYDRGVRARDTIAQVSGGVIHNG